MIEILRGTTKLCFAAALVAVAGCATPSQREAQQTEAQLKAFADFRACMTQVAQKPEYASLLPHTVHPETRQFTPEQLADPNRPTAAEARLVAARFAEFAPCRDQLVKTTGVTDPKVLPALAKAYSTNEANVSLLIARKITWGENARRAQAMIETFNNDVDAVDK